MSKLLRLLACVLAALLPGTASVAIENGDSALGHPRIISTNPFGGSAFLYSERIVFTQGHAVAGKPLDFFRVALPGTVTSPDNAFFEVVKVFVADGYREWDPKYDWSRPNDFAILILNKPVPNTSRASLADQAFIDELRLSGSTVSVGGYGYQSADDRNTDYSRTPRRVEPKISHHKFANGDYLAPAMTAQAAAWPGFKRPKDVPDYLKYHVYAPLGGPSTCDGDSGSGYFVEASGETIYLGTQGFHLGIPNCGIDDPIGIIPLQGINPVYPYLDLIREAEEWVALHPAASISRKLSLQGTDNGPAELTQEQLTEDLLRWHPYATRMVCTAIRPRNLSIQETTNLLARAEDQCDKLSARSPVPTTSIRMRSVSAGNFPVRIVVELKYD